jgi:adenosylcobinamide-GDP ribazoletransferase
MLKVLRQFLLATSYLTCLPTAFLVNSSLLKAKEGSERHPETDLLSGLSVYLASVGLLVGLALSGLASFLTHVQSPDFLRGVLLAVVWLALTNGLHFDGLMDTADGIFSHRDKATTIEIMSDPRVGNFAVMVAVCVLLIKAACLAALPPANLCSVLILTPAWARWAESFAIGKFSYLKAAGKGKIWHDTIRFPVDLYLGALPPLAMLLACAHSGIAAPVAISSITAVIGMATAFWINKKLGGQTGDTYGAVVELAETGGLLVFTLACGCS